MRRITIDDIIFFILIALIIALAIWKLFGSPTDTASLIALSLFIAGSEILIWKAIFKIDKKTSIGFIKIKKDISNFRNEVKSKFDNIENLITKKGRK